VICKISGSHRGVHEDPSLLVGYAMLTGIELTNVFKRQYCLHL